MPATRHPFVALCRIRRLSNALLLVGVWLLYLSPQRANAHTRVALVSTCGGEAGQNVLALADVALSAETNIVLVERRDVERVLQEQNLMHCGLSEAGQAVAAGQLLGVQVFASLETVPDQKEALGLVVFDAATGLVLWDSVLSGTNAEVAAVEADAAVEASCEKRQRPAGSLTRVCILSVRNVDLPRQFDSSCQSVGSILQRQLVRSPSLAVLERQHLENVNKERLLPRRRSDEPTASVPGAHRTGHLSQRCNQWLEWDGHLVGYRRHKAGPSHRERGVTKPRRPERSFAH